MRLTPRQREIAALLAEAYTNREIAARLGLKPPTVRAHLHNMAIATGARNRVDLARMWWLGVVPDGAAVGSEDGREENHARQGSGRTE